MKLGFRMWGVGEGRQVSEVEVGSSVLLTLDGQGMIGLEDHGIVPFDYYHTARTPISIPGWNTGESEFIIFQPHTGDKFLAYASIEEKGMRVVELHVNFE